MTNAIRNSLIEGSHSNERREEFMLGRVVKVRLFYSLLSLTMHL